MFKWDTPVSAACPDDPVDVEGTEDISLPGGSIASASGVSSCSLPSSTVCRSCLQREELSSSGLASTSVASSDRMHLLGALDFLEELLEEEVAGAIASRGGVEEEELLARTWWLNRASVDNVPLNKKISKDRR